jgi:hypothetical protein
MTHGERAGQMARQHVARRENEKAQYEDSMTIEQRASFL